MFGFQAPTIRSPIQITQGHRESRRQGEGVSQQRTLSVRSGHVRVTSTSMPEKRMRVRRTWLWCVTTVVLL